ncbi:hypothetical protein [Kocuria sp. cx-455]|uniref:hypothetical protein n=1 Tax=Kocuria sp. cx-455 TaxID=2771377 RepID=UPI003D747D10
MATPSRQPDPEPDPMHPGDSPHHGNSAPDAGRAADTQKSRPQDSATGTAPLIEDSKDTGGNKHRLNAARMEVRLRRIALLGLVLVPLLYFIVQSLR